jgi:hypothetical protein
MTIVLSGSERGTVLVITRSSCHNGQFCSYFAIDTAELPVTVSNLAFRLTTTFFDLQVVCFGAFKRFVSVTILESIIRTYNMAIYSVLDGAIEKEWCCQVKSFFSFTCSHYRFLPISLYSFFLSI